MIFSIVIGKEILMIEKVLSVSSRSWTQHRRMHTIERLNQSIDFKRTSCRFIARHPKKAKLAKEKDVVKEATDNQPTAGG